MNASQLLWSIKVLSEAYRVKAHTGFPASAITAQAILETGYGRYVPRDINTGKYSYNLFGIKGNGDNGHVECYTKEYYNNQWITILAWFRAYNSYEESFNDYISLIKNAPRYAKALEYLNNPKRYIQEIWRAGYATDPDYVTKVCAIIDQLNKIPVVLLNLC